MKRTLTLIAVCSLISSVHAAEDAADFNRYQVIIERAPFGAVASGDAAETVPGFAERFAYTGTAPSTRTNELLAIITDTQSNRSELVPVGGTFGEGGEIKVVQIHADPENSRVVIKSGLEEATLRLRPPDKAPAPGPVATGPAQVNPVPVQPNAGSPRIVVPARRRTVIRRGAE